jgi:hypothetical protein
MSFPFFTGPTGFVPNTARGNNPGVQGPDTSPTATDFELSFTAKGSGLVLVIASMTIGAQAAGQQVLFHLSMDGAFSAELAQLDEAGQNVMFSGAGGFPASATLMGLFTVTPGTAHTFGIQGVNVNTGQTQILSTGLASVFIYELP